MDHQINKSSPLGVLSWFKLTSSLQVSPHIYIKALTQDGNLWGDASLSTLEDLWMQARFLTCVHIMICFLRWGTCGLVAMTSASHAEGRQFDPGQVYAKFSSPETNAWPRKKSNASQLLISSLPALMEILLPQRRSASTSTFLGTVQVFSHYVLISISAKNIRFPHGNETWSE